LAAASIAASTSAVVESWNSPMTSSWFAEFLFSKVLPDTDGVHAPAM
jgi:hypothetical protein